MADFRENVLPVVFNSLFSEKNDTDNIRNNVETIKQNQLLKIQKSASLQDFISKTHIYLNCSKDRATGLILLNQIIQQCNTEIFQSHSPTWLRLLLQILQGHALPSVYTAACHLMGQVLQFSRHFTDLSRDIVATTIPQLVPVLLAASSEWRGAALRCITVCLQTYPGPMTTHRNKIETLVLKELENDSCSKEATGCLCHLVRCGGGGNQGNKHTDNWVELCDRMIGSLSETLTTLYEGLEAGSTTEGAGPRLVLKSIDSSKSDRLSLCVRRWTVLSTCLQTLLGTEFHSVARIPADVIIKLICRCLAINRKMLMSRATAERTSLAIQLPIIHIGALKILKQLTLTTLLVPYCRVVIGYLSQELLWTHWPNTEGHDKPYGMLRSCLYDVLCVWLKVLDGCSGFVHEEKCIIREMLHDVTPEKDTLKIDHTPRTATPDGPPVKKKHKGGNYEVSQGISSQRKVHSDANSTLVQTGLEALYWIVTTVGPELERKSIHSIQEFTIKTILLVQNSSIIPVPYRLPECRKGLYRALLGLTLTPHPTAPPPIQCATRCFSVGQQDRNSEVSSYCLQALRTCEVLIHPRVPCLNGPIICENLVTIDDDVKTVTETCVSNTDNSKQSVTGTSVRNWDTSKQSRIGYSEPIPSTSQSEIIQIGGNGLQNEIEGPMDSQGVENVPIVYRPVNDTSFSDLQNKRNKYRDFIGSLRNRDSAGELLIQGSDNTAGREHDSTATENTKTTTIEEKDVGSKVLDVVVEINETSGSESDSNDKSKKRTRKEKNVEDGPSNPKYTKLKDSDAGISDNSISETSKTNGDINDDISAIPKNDVIDLDDSSSDSSNNDKGKCNGDRDKSKQSSKAGLPTPSTSKAGAIDIDTDDSSSSDEIEIEEDANKNNRTVKDITESGKEKLNEKDGAGSEEKFIITDSNGNKEVLTAIPIKDVGSDQVISPDVQAMLSTFVDADPDPE